MINKKWRLSPAIKGYLVNKYNLYLTNQDSKTHQKGVLRSMYPGIVPMEIDLTDAKFSLSLSKGMIPKVKSSSLPEPEKEYTLENYEITKDVMSSLLGCLDYVNKEFIDSSFDVAFTEDTNDGVQLVCPGMSEYSQALSEMSRRLNCSLMKKTKKLVAGHRYDLPDSTIYWLGEYWTRKSDLTNSEFLLESEMIQVGLYVEELESHEKTVSDIFKNRTYGNEEGNIKVMYKPKMMVDSGEKLINDSVDLDHLWKTQLDSAITRNTLTSEKGYTSIVNPVDILNIFCYSSAPTNTWTEEVDKLKKVLKTVLTDALVRYWNIKTRSDLSLLPDQSVRQNSENLVRQVIQEFRDKNALKHTYYKSLFEFLGIDIESLADEALLEWDENLVTADFDSYLKYEKYFIARGRTYKFLESRNRVESTVSKLDVTKVLDLITQPTLRDAVCSLANSAINNYGVGVSSINLINIGTRQSPREYVEVRITLEDILEFNDSDEIKDQILSTKFRGINIFIDKDKTVE